MNFKFNRRSFLGAGFASLCMCSNIDAAQQLGLVDYLRQTKRPFDKDSRRLLWNNYKPAVKYQFTSSQNEELLKALKLFDAAPVLRLKSTTIH